MIDELEIAGVGLTAFASTNLDNLLLLTLLQGQKQQSRRAVFLGYVGSVTAIAIMGLIVARLADTFPADMLGYLGLVPLGMGLYRLYRLAKLVGRSDGDSEPSESNAALGAASIAALAFANSADTLGVLLPLFAETAEPLSFVLATAIVVAATLWVAMSKWISGHPWVRRTLARAERWLVPTLLIVVGLYILLNSPTDTVPGQSFSLDDDLG